MRRDRLELLLASFLMLFVELVLIRWAGAYVVYLSYFSNFVLLGSFLGIGIGFLRAHRQPDLFRWSPVALAVFIGLVKSLPVVIDRSGGDVIFFGALETKGLPAWVMLPFVFLAVTAVLATIAHGVAVRFAKFPALEAYRLDIGGAVLGVVTYAVASLLGVPPLGWALVIIALYVYLLRPFKQIHMVAAAVLLIVTAFGTFTAGTVWSPYYRLEFNETNLGIRANGVPHQRMETIVRGTPYQNPYAWSTTPPRDVLVIGAGNGNDVAAALDRGASSIDAVEIDPTIQDLGAEHHPLRPYADPRVRRIINDGRAYLEQTDETYDLIVFALPDSLTLVAGQSAIRLESFLFTREAVEAAKARLNPGGSFAIYNFYREAWLLDRLANTLQTTFDQTPCLYIGGEGGGDVGAFAMLAVGTADTSLSCNRTWAPTGEVIEPATDDRPFVYLRERSIPSRYLWALGLVLLTSAALVRFAGARYRAMGGYLDLFFMGAAFLLLETKSVVQFALLFGTTWFVNALVFAGILLTVLLAIEVERKLRIGRPTLLFSLLFLGLLIAGIVPTSALLELSAVPRFIAATSLAFFPVFIANLVFAGRFRDTEDPTTAFGANLLGAMVGGAIEYVSLVTGYRALLVVAAVLYLLAYITGARKVGGAKSARSGERVPQPEPAPA